MTSLANHHSTSIVKLLLIGDAKTGKTGSCISLVKAGYKLHFLDFDNLLDYLYARIMAECPDKLDNVDYITLRDPVKSSSTGAVFDGKPQTWISAMKFLDKWDDGTVPAQWGSDHILVVDSLSRLCDAAYFFHESAVAKGHDGRAIFGNAQDDAEKVISMLTSKSFSTNVIVIAHGMYMEMENGAKKIFPYGIGQKLSPKIPSYFPNYILYTLDGQGKRTIKLEGNNTIALSVARQFPTKDLPIDTGLADFFAAFREPPAKSNSPKVLQLDRKP